MRNDTGLFISSEMQHQRYSIDRLTRAQEDYNRLYAKANGLEDEYNAMIRARHPFLSWLADKIPHQDATVDHEYMATFFKD